MSDVMGKGRAAAVVNIPAELFAAVMTEAQHTITYRRQNRAEFGKLDHIDADGLLEKLVETATKLGAAARPGPGGCECVNTLRAERDEALAVLRAIVARDDDTPLKDEWWSPPNYNPGEHVTSAELAAALTAARAILSKHAKPDGGAT